MGRGIHVPAKQTNFMELFNDFFMQLGAIGLMVLGLTWFSRYLFRYFMQQMNEEREQNRTKNEEFMQFIMGQNHEHLKVIRKNTEVNERLITFLERGLVDYMEKRAKSQADLNNELRNLVIEVQKQTQKDN